MKIVSHQYKAQDRRFKMLPRFAEQLEEASTIALVSENRLARPNMIKGLFTFEGVTAASSFSHTPTHPDHVRF
jgi:hypothetical protein